MSEPSERSAIESAAADVAADLALRRAGADEEEARIQHVRDLGLDLVNQFFMSLRTLTLHDAANRATYYPIEATARTLTELLGVLGTVHLIAVEQQAYINDIRLRVESQAYANVLYVLQVMERHGVGGVTFTTALDEQKLRRLFVSLLAPPASGGDKLAALRQRIADEEVPVELDSPFFFARGADVASTSRGTTQHAAFEYAKGLLAIKDYVRAVEAEGLANPLRIRKVVQDLVDTSMEDFDDFLKLHAIHGAEDALYNHSINVCSLSIAIGKELGLGRVELADLGTAALLHDMGYAAHGVADLDELQRDRALHTIAAARVLLRPYEMTSSLVRRMRVVLEHHAHFRRPGGYPLLGAKSLSVISRIVAVADSYDALLTPTEHDVPLVPVKALERVVASAGIRFDPLVVRALVRVVGRYPFGSIVRLSTGEVCLVICGGRDGPAFARPKVRVVRDTFGEPVEESRVIDLAVPESRFRKIVQVLDPMQEGVAIGHYLFGDASGPEVAADIVE
ncbi:HD domain-containing protein [Myxococcota bacterium]|nr:HD domain-containing protein [Myxococcota bacterium]